MKQTKQARALDEKRLKQALAAAKSERDTAMLLLSIKSGLRAIEIAGLTWGNIDFEAPALLLKQTKGDVQRIVPLGKEVVQALLKYRATLGGRHGPERPVFTNHHARPGEALTANAVTVWFHRFYAGLGWERFSSHSGRRTFATNVARNIIQAGGSLKDLQTLLGHADLSTTAKYIEASEDAQKRVVDMI
jgi:integrase